MPNRPTERGKSLLLQKEMNQKHCKAKTSTLNGSALSTKCRKYEKVVASFSCALKFFIARKMFRRHAFTKFITK